MVKRGLKEIQGDRIALVRELQVTTDPVFRTAIVKEIGELIQETKGTLNSWAGKSFHQKRAWGLYDKPTWRRKE